MKALWGFFSFGARHPLVTLLVLGVLTGIAALGLPQVRINVSHEALIDPSDPELPVYHQVVAQFGSDTVTAIYLRDDDLFTPEKLKAVDALANALAREDFVERVDSLFSMANLSNEDDAIDTSPIFTYVPETVEEAETGRDKAFGNPFVIDNLISRDAKATVIAVYTKPGYFANIYEDRTFEVIEAMLTPLRASFDRAVQVGKPRAETESLHAVSHDLVRLAPFAGAVILLINFMLLRTWVGVVLPFLTSAVSIVLTMGLCGHLGIALNSLSASAPVLLVVMGSTEDTYLLSAYLGAMRAGAVSRMDAVNKMIRHAALPTVLTAGTTALGFGTGLLSHLGVLRDFAVVCSIGMVANLVVTVLVVPLFLSRLGPRAAAAPQGRPLFEAVGAFIETTARGHSRALLGLTAGLIAICLGFMVSLQPNNDPLSFLRNDHPIIQDAEQLHADVAGSGLFYITIEGPEPGIFLEPDTLDRLAGLADAARATGKFDKVLCLADHLNWVHQVFGPPAAAPQAGPDSRAMSEQYLLFFQRRDIEQFASHDYKTANILVRHFLRDSRDKLKAVAEIEQLVKEAFPPNFKSSIVSEEILIDRSSKQLVTSQFLSFGLMLAVVVVLISVSYRSARMGLAAAVSNLLPAVSVFAVMGLSGIPLNPGTALVAVIGLSVAVDDTIHLSSAYHHLVAAGRDRAEAAFAAMRSQVPAVMTTSVSLVAGLLVLTMSEFNIVSQLGILCAASIAVAAMVDLFVTPLVLRLLRV